MKHNLLILGLAAIGCFATSEAKEYHFSAPASRFSPVSTEQTGWNVMRNTDCAATPFSSLMKTPAAKKTSTRSDEAEYVYATCTLNPSADGRYQPVGVVIFANDEGWDADYGQGETTKILDVEKGTYSVLGIYVYDQSVVEAIYTPAWALVIRENVEINDNIEITMSADEATKQVKFRQQLPSGQDLLLPEILSFDETGKAVYNKDEDSYNVVQLLTYNYLVHEDGSSLSFDGNPYCRLSTGETGEASADFLINEISDKWTLIQTRCPMGCDDDYYAVFSTKGVGNLEVKANAGDFYHYNPEYAHSKVFKDYPDTGNGVGIIHGFLCDGRMITDTYIIAQRSGKGVEFPDWYIYGSNNTCATPYELPFIKDGVVSVMGNDFDAIIVGAPVTVKDGVAVHTVAGAEFLQIDSARGMLFMFDEDGNYRNMNGHEFFSLKDNEINSAIGNNVPALTVNAQEFASLIGFTEHKIIIPMPSYIGRLGENRLADNVVMDFTIDFNGEKVGEGSNYQVLMMTMMQMAQEGVGGGDWKVRFENRNILVDDMEGSCIGETGYNDIEEDPFAPTLRYLQFRDKNGMPADRFNKAEDAMVYLAGADYTGVPNMDIMGCVMIPNPMKVKVEYAPYGTDDFEEIPVAEDASMYTHDSLGYVYKGSMADVDRKSENGWFDLRVTLTDDTDNYQIQTLSPAFYVAGLSGVRPIADESEEIRIEGCNIYAGASATIAAMDGTVCDGRNLAPGVYIVKSGDRVKKVIVR